MFGDHVNSDGAGETAEGGVGTRSQIDDQLVNAHTIVTVDIDNDGRDEVVVGQRGGARMPMLYTASADGASWTKRALDDEGSMAAAGCAAADLNADKRVDVVCIGTATQNLKWYENVGKR